MDDSSVSIWQFPLEASAEFVAELERLLSTDEHHRASRFRFERDQRRFVVARGILRLLLSRQLSVPPDAVVFTYGPHGKPAVACNGPTEVQFNASHSGDIGLIALTFNDEVGIDIEMIRHIPNWQQIGRSYFTPAEFEAIAALPPHVQLSAFFTCWTRKEAYLKAVGFGLSQSLASFGVSPIPGAAGVLRLFDEPVDGIARHWLHDLSALPEYAAALAVRGTPRRVNLTRISHFELQSWANLSS